MTMPYISAPRWAKIIDRAGASFGYVLLAVLGVAEVLLIPLSRSLSMGEAIHFGLAWVLIISALVATLGAALNKYQWEWAAIWFVMSGVASSIDLSVTFTMGSAFPRAYAAFALTGVAVMTLFIEVGLLRRWVSLVLIAKADRANTKIRKRRRWTASR